MFDKNKSMKLAELAKDALIKCNMCGLTDADVTLKQESSGEVEVTILKGKVVTTGTQGATAKNISGAIDNLYKKARSEGNVFTQPVSGSFTVAVKMAKLSESVISFKSFLENNYK